MSDDFNKLHNTEQMAPIEQDKRKWASLRQKGEALYEWKAVSGPVGGGNFSTLEAAREAAEEAGYSIDDSLYEDRRGLDD